MGKGSPIGGLSPRLQVEIDMQNESSNSWVNIPPLILLPEDTKGCKTRFVLQPLFIRVCEQTYSASSATFSASKAAKSSARNAWM